jgi:hypothetical protein
VLGDTSFSNLVGLVVQVLILLPVTIAALNALSLDAVTGPASEMLGRVLAAVPALFAATLLLAAAYVAGRLASSLVTRVLSAAGFDRLPGLLGVTVPDGGERPAPSRAAGALVLAAILVFGTIEASRLLGFDQFAAMLGELLTLAGRLGLALAVFAAGLYLADLAARTIAASGAAHADLLAPTARIAVIVFAGAMALGETGLADNIVNLAFGLLLGAVAVAAAIAFGLGSRDVAGRLVESWTSQLQNRRG